MYIFRILVPTSGSVFNSMFSREIHTNTGTGTHERALAQRERERYRQRMYVCLCMCVFVAAFACSHSYGIYICSTASRRTRRRCRRKTERMNERKKNCCVNAICVSFGGCATVMCAPRICCVWFVLTISISICFCLSVFRSFVRSLARSLACSPIYSLARCLCCPPRACTVRRLGSVYERTLTRSCSVSLWMHAGLIHSYCVRRLLGICAFQFQLFLFISVRFYFHSLFPLPSPLLLRWPLLFMLLAVFGFPLLVRAG